LFKFFAINKISQANGEEENCFHRASSSFDKIKFRVAKDSGRTTTTVFYCCCFFNQQVAKTIFSFFGGGGNLCYAYMFGLSYVCF
jgi:hypothetical protein